MEESTQKAWTRRHDVSNDIPEKTATQNRWGANIWMEWAKCHNSENVDTADYVPVPESLHTCTREELGYWLPFFVEEVRRRDGTEYPYNSIYQICCAVRRYMNSYHHSQDIAIFNRQDVMFSKFNTVLDSKLEEGAGKGSTINTRVPSDPITRDEEVALWKAGVINTDSPLGLSFAVFFYNCRVFNIISKDEHYNLTTDQYKFHYDHESGQECIEFERILGKRTRGVARKVKNYNDRIRHFGDQSHPRCIVAIFKKYLSLIPSGHFYIVPNTGSGNGRPLYSSRHIGTNKLRVYLKIMLKLAKINIGNRKITTNSLKYDRLTYKKGKESEISFVLPLDTLLRTPKSSPCHVPNEQQHSLKLDASEYNVLSTSGSHEMEMSIVMSSDKDNDLSKNQCSNITSPEEEIPVVAPSDNPLNQNHDSNISPSEMEVTVTPEEGCRPVNEIHYSNIDNQSHSYKWTDMKTCANSNGTSVTMVKSLKRSSWTQTPNLYFNSANRETHNEDHDLPDNVKNVMDYVRNTGGGRISIELDEEIISKVIIDL